MVNISPPYHPTTTIYKYLKFKFAVVTESILDIPKEKLTPGMQQYQQAKQENPDCLILLRMGDFFEMFYEDAVTCSKELEITLTARGKGEKKAPLAGIPYHALDNYLGRLVKKGYKVAIIEQLEDPKKAKGLVKRGLVRIVTPGTVVESSMLEEKENNYIMSLHANQDLFTAAFCDISTGEFFTTSYQDFNTLRSEIIRLTPSECVVPESLQVNQELIKNIKDTGCFVHSYSDFYFKIGQAKTTLAERFNTNSLGLEDSQLAVSGGLLQYLIATQKNNLSHLKRPTLRTNQKVMPLDSATYKNLELVKNLQDGTTKGTILSVIDKTVTSLGSRQLKKWLKKPLLDVNRINKRLDAIEELNKNIIVREEIRDIFKEVFDIERLISRVNYGNASPRDLLSLKQSLQQVPKVRELLQDIQSPLLQEIEQMDVSKEIFVLLESSIKDDANISIRDGNIIKRDFNKELDSLHEIKSNSRNFLQKLEEQEREKTGISGLKIGFNKVFGYFIEVTKRNSSLVPENYIRKQTTANGERYITEELKVEEEKILGAQEKIAELEYNLFQEILQDIAKETVAIQKVASRIAVLDVLCSLSKVSMEFNYCKPVFVGENVLQIKNGRHPVVERLTERFIPNDVMLSNGEMMVITGPNMAGKSTVMRQTALIVLLAQIGSFIPAEECVLGVVDRIFTRVGAHDDLGSGQSTFLVEMNETAAILHNATEKSLIILDEIGRGTSTFDGVSIAWSVAEYIYNSVKAKTLFATHYHVLNTLADKFSRISNYNIAVKDVQGELVFLHKLIAGGTDASYGVHVAQMAGLPNEVIDRAKQIQGVLEKDDAMVRKIKVKKIEEQKGLGEF